MLTRLARNRFLWLILLFVFIVPSFYFLLEPRIFWSMHDDIQMMYQLEMEKCISDGQIPCRWTPELANGYGYPLFNYYPPLPYLVGEVFHIFRFSLVTTVKFTALSQILLSALAMYLLGAEFNGPFTGFLAALFYTYAPYHAVNLYVRGAMNESWAAVFFPLLFLASYRLIRKPGIGNILYLSLSYCFLLLSHNPMVLIFTPFLIVWCIYWLFDHYNLKLKDYRIPLLKFSLAGFFALSLAAFFTLPMLFETKYVQISAMFEDYYYYANHFVTLKQLFISNFWGNGGSVLGSGDGMSFSVGYLHWIIPAIGILIAFYLLLKKPKQYLRLIMPFLLLSFLGFFATFMATHGSTFIWEIFKILQEIQFPWRFLNLANFFFSASIVFLVLLFQKFKINRLTSIIALGFIVIALILINYKHFYPITSYSLTDQQWFNDSWTLQKRGTIDYLPTTALGYPKHPAQDYVDAIIPTTVIYKISNASKGSDWISFNLELSDNATITLPVLAFPGFKLLDFGEEISYMIETSSGRIIVNLSAGSHVLYLKLYNTPIRALSDYWSLLAWILIFFFFVKNSWKKLSSRKILKTTVV